jgi:hypothetical protein
MKIGLSYSRCLADIIDGKVDIKEVLVVISRTNFDPRNSEQWDSIWNGYVYGANPAWRMYSEEDKERFHIATIELYEAGKLHQPRQFGSHPTHVSYYWLEAQLPTEELENHPSAKKAWERYQIIAGLSNTTQNLSYELDDNF